MGIQTLVAAQSDGWIRSTLQHLRRMLGLRLRLVVAVVLVTVAAEADVAADDADVAADVPFSQPQWPTRAGCPMRASLRARAGTGGVPGSSQGPMALP